MSPGNIGDMPEADPSGIDLTSFLMACNAFMAACILFLCWFTGCNEYVSPYAVHLSIVLAAQNFFFLLSARRRPNPFVVITAFYAIFFYELRVVTLLWDPWSIVFVRNSFSAPDLSAGLLYVIFSNLAIFVGVSLASGPDLSRPPLSGYTDASIRLLPPFLLMGAGVMFERGLNLPSILKGYLGILINTEMILLFLLITGILYHGIMTGAQRLLLFSAVALFVICRTAMGSRSALVTLLVSFLCAWSAVHGRLLFKRKLYYALAGIAPLALGAFLFATYLRAPKVPVQFQAVSNRLGFLDMTSEIIASGSAYRSVVNFTHYFRSIVDNGLTPGFNLFDAPKAANSLSLIYYGIPSMSLKTVALHYQSDMLTVYAEARLLFGPIAGLVAIAVAAFFFRVLYAMPAQDDPVRSAGLRSIVLMLFYTYFLGSFGLDWFIVDLIRGVIPFCALLYFFSLYVQTVPGSERRSVL